MAGLVVCPLAKALGLLVYNYTYTFLFSKFPIKSFYLTGERQV